MAESGKIIICRYPSVMSTLRILLAEDNLINQQVVVRMLQKLGYSPDVASDGEGAVALAREQSYDLIFMDLMMPRMDGYEATGIIRSAESDGQRAYIVALTANAMGSDRTRCLEAGMDDFMTKPFMMETLKEKLSVFEHIRAESPSHPVDVDEFVDRSVLRSLATMMDEDDTAYIRELMTDYLTDAERLRAEIYQAVADKDADALRRATHSLKATSATFGARHLSSLCAEFEQCSVRADIQAVESRLAEFDATLESFHTALVEVVETSTY